jgi:hypothetical protein
VSAPKKGIEAGSDTRRFERLVGLFVEVGYREIQLRRVAYPSWFPALNGGCRAVEYSQYGESWECLRLKAGEQYGTVSMVKRYREWGATGLRRHKVTG